MGGVGILETLLDGWHTPARGVKGLLAGLGLLKDLLVETLASVEVAREGDVRKKELINELAPEGGDVGAGALGGRGSG